jgi:hypothetical protein
MKWISESELVINNKVYQVTNPEWIKNLLKNLEEKDDNDTPKDHFRDAMQKLENQ